MERSGKENWEEEVALRGRGGRRRQMKRRKRETKTSLPEERERDI